MKTVCCLLLFFLSVPWLRAAEKVTFENQVRPILRQHCVACHNQDDPTASLALDSFEGISNGGASGQVLSPGDPEASRLWKLVTHQEEPNMPPDDKLPEKKLEVLRRWIEGGLLKDEGSQPLRSNKPKIAKLDTTQIGRPEGEPAIPKQLFHEPVLWTPKPGPVNVLATSPWAPLVAIAWQRQISFYNTNSYRLLGIIPYLDGVPTVVRFSRDGSLLLVAGGRHAAVGSATLFDVKTGRRLATFGDELDIVLAADVSPDLSLVALGGPKKIVRVYHVADGSLAYKINKHTDWITALGFSPDGRQLATADRNGGARLWQAAQGHERSDLKGHQGPITSLDWRTDSAMLATSSEDGTVRLWNPAGKQIQSVSAHKKGVLSVRFAKNGNWVTTGRDRKVKTWQSDGKAIATLSERPNMTLMADFTHDNSKVIASDYTGKVQILDVASKEQLTVLLANPLRLSQRLADAKKAFQKTQQKLLSSENIFATLQATFEQGKSAHATHEQKQTKAQNQLATEKKLYDQITQKLATLQKQEKPAEEDLASATQKQQAAEKVVQAAEATLAQVTNETAGLPDLVKLEEQSTQARANVLAAQKKQQQTQKKKNRVATQQARFLQATAEFANQSKTLQSKLAKLRSSKATLQEQKEKLAKELVKTENALSETEQKHELMEAVKNDFEATNALRKSYSGD